MDRKFLPTLDSQDPIRTCRAHRSSSARDSAQSDCATVLGCGNLPSARSVAEFDFADRNGQDPAVGSNSLRLCDGVRCAVDDVLFGDDPVALATPGDCNGLWSASEGAAGSE